MAKVHTVMKARKAKPEYGIAVGDTYYWWAFRIGRSSIKRYSKTYPKRSQLTMSDYYANLYDMEDRFNEMADQLSSGADPDTVADDLEGMASDVRDLGQEQEEKRYNMEEKFPSGCPVMETLEARSGFCENLADELEQLASTIRDTEPEETDCDTCCGYGYGTVECQECVDWEDNSDCGECQGSGEVQEECSSCMGVGNFNSDTINDSQRDELASEFGAIDWSGE